MGIRSAIKSLFRGSEVKESSLAMDPWNNPGLANFRQFLGLYAQIDREARGRGGNIQDRPIDERMLFIARGLWKYNPYAKGFVKALAMYTLGERGFRYEVVSEETKCQKLAQAYIDKFIEVNKWRKWEKDAYRSVHIEGEKFLRFFPNDDEQTVDLREVSPEWIIAPNGDVDWTFGIQNAPGDVMKILAYCSWHADGQEIIPAEEIHHIKPSDTPISQKRGESDFLSTCQIFDDSLKNWKNFAQSEAVRQAIIYFSKQAEGVTGADLDAVIAGQSDYSAPVGRTSGNSNTKFQQGAAVEYLTAGTELASVPTAENVAGTVAGINEALLLCGRNYHMPLHILTGNQSQNNLPDWESPFAAAIADEQAWFSEEYRQVFTRVIEIGVEEGHLPAEVLDCCKMSVTPEQRPPRDAGAATVRYQTLRTANLISDRQWTTEEGYDYDEQQKQRQKDGDKDVPPEVSPPAESKL